MKNAITVENLEKSYGAAKVLKGISFTVAPGEIFALLGINGAGKTTTLECMEGLRSYDSGSIRLNGKRSVQLQSASLPEHMKAKEAISFFANWKKAKISAEYLESLGVTPFLNQTYKRLSTGQKRRLHLALAMLGDPDILFLDEPTAGLDVEGRASLHKEILKLQEKGKTILMASHDMAEVEELCNRISILKAGEIVFTGTSYQLTESLHSSFQLQVRFGGKPDFASVPYLRPSSQENGFYIFQCENLAETMVLLGELAQKQKISIKDIHVMQDSLEQKFLSVVQE